MTRWFQIAAGLLIVILVVGLYRAKTEAEAARARVNTLERQNAQTEARIRALRAEIATLESPGRVEALARRELGLQVGQAGVARRKRDIASSLPAPERHR